VSEKERHPEEGVGGGFSVYILSVWLGCVYVELNDRDKYILLNSRGGRLFWVFCWVGVSVFFFFVFVWFGFFWSYQVEGYIFFGGGFWYCFFVFFDIT